ncbi:hypothetical protein BJX96DRAFT_162461 [Aspergillus floccosus]
MRIDTTLQASGFRPRRRHEKSRSGCLRCKRQRKKCDELRPSCSRCTKGTYRCRYESCSSDDTLSKEQASTCSPVPSLHVPCSSPNIALPGSELPFAPTPSPSLGRRSVSISSSSKDTESLALDSYPSHTLDAREMGLLTHYLTHTSQIIPVDDLDLYALSVGVPNLAFNCKAVMSSLIALAAACKSHDLAKQPQTGPSRQDLIDIGELLGLAERHHRSSLRHIQETMQSPDSYDYILANAALMVLYVSANHSVRVHLAATAKQRGRWLPNEVLPQHSQWISFTRAAHTASSAILKDVVGTAEENLTANTTVVVDAWPKSLEAAECSTVVLTPQDGPSDQTRQLFLPIVKSTYRRALETLRRRAEAVAALLQRPGPSGYNNNQLQACLETVSVLEKCTSAALSEMGNESVAAPANQFPSSDGLSRVSPWVARYMISVTSMESPRVLRRIIMSFLNKATAEYLSLVQSVLDAPSAEARAQDWMTQDSARTGVPSLSETHHLAMDIFAHWLVLVMLLDGVWWIGDTGEWELGQIVSLMKAWKSLSQSADIGETWWPESMYLVKRELTHNAQ